MTALEDAVGLRPGEVAALLDRYAERGWTVATAESMTGGLLAALLTEIPGSSEVVRGGLVVYATDLKAALAGVDAGLLAARGPVDPEVARQLADGARRRCGATVGVAITGVAGPDPQDGVPVGTWFCAVVGAGGVSEVGSGTPDGPEVRESGGPAARASIRGAAVAAAIALLFQAAATAS